MLLLLSWINEDWALCVSVVVIGARGLGVVWGVVVVVNAIPLFALKEIRGPKLICELLATVTNGLWVEVDDEIWISDWLKVVGDKNEFLCLLKPGVGDISARLNIGRNPESGLKLPPTPWGFSISCWEKLFWEFALTLE